MIDAQRTAFITSGVSIVAASRGPGNAPAIARAAGCRASPDSRRITLFFASSQAGELLDAIRATGAISVVFSQPSTHRTIQLKGADAGAGVLQPGDREVIEAPEPMPPRPRGGAPPAAGAHAGSRGEGGSALAR